MIDPTLRFSNRVANYVRYRPDYPEALIETLSRRGIIQSDSIWADIGAGTGLWTRQLAPRLRAIHAVEPNADMREAAKDFLSGLDNVQLSIGTAEATGLPDSSFDVVTAAQAFHWFDREAFGHECRRLLRPDGHVLLVWNEREIDTTPFLRGYEQVLQDHASDYLEVNHQNISTAAFAEFFGSGGYELIEHPHVQYFDYEGLAGRLLSSSYVPTAEHPRYPAMMAALRACFEATAENGKIAFGYTTRAYLGAPAGR